MKRPKLNCTPVTRGMIELFVNNGFPTSLGARLSHAEEEEGLVNLHTYKFEVHRISAG